MVAAKLKLMFLVILPLQLCATLSQQKEHEIDGVSMSLHMKMRMKSGSTKKITLKEPLYYPVDNFPVYYIKLSVGTPPQDLLLVVDTGSHVVWTPCTHKFTCECQGYVSTFLPTKSSSAVPVKCADPKCKELCEKAHCAESFQKCSRICPQFSLTYVTGNTTGRLLSDTLTLPLEDGGRREIKNFAIGCSVRSFGGAAGIAGFGRGGLPMPSQLAPLIGDKFAYCLEQVINGSKIVLGNKAVPRDIALTYIPLLINPIYPIFYYLGLQAVSIGAKRLTLPSNLLSFDSQGNGGTIIASGSSLTSFPDSIFKQIVAVFASQIRYRRFYEGDNGSGLCYNVSGVENIQWPKFAFHFNGGSQMVLPEENGFTNYGINYYADDLLCLAMLNRGIAVNGPAVIIGNIQQNNFYILYDREKNRLGFTQGACKTFG